MSARPKTPTSAPGAKRPRLSSRQLFFYIAALLLAVVLLVTLFQKNKGTYTRIPKEYQIKYMPADFKPQLDTENALSILSNPYRYNREFNDLIYQFNLSLLDHVANRMGLSDSLKLQVHQVYDKHHPYISRLYFNEFTAMQDTTSELYQKWYNSESTDAVAILKEVSSKYTCFLTNLIFSSILETDEGKLFVYGRNVDSPCGVALTEALQPMMDRLQETAAIRDFTASKGFLEKRVERVTAELATMEIRDKKGLNKQMQTKLWGFSVSTTELEVIAISVLKVGFDLLKYFQLNLDPRTNVVTVTLPEPEILSHEVYPKIEKLDIGWLREVKSVDFNKNFNLLRKEFRREALESDVMDKSKAQAVEIMQLMLGPLINSMNRQYKLEVKFKNLNPTQSDEEYFDSFSREALNSQQNSEND
ncbi:MAG: DUF4230 domain-containing protein [Saprospirales bacterium]|nr:DUF4230 domain-containing protein [Saprospirales bacterium]